MKPPVLIVVTLLGIAGCFLGARLAGLIGPTEAPAPLTPTSPSGLTANPSAVPEAIGSNSRLGPAEHSEAHGETPSDGAPPTAEEAAPTEAEAATQQGLEERNKRRAQAQRLARNEKQDREFQRKAERIANQLNLPSGSADKIAELYRAERNEIDALRTEFLSTAPSPASRQAMNNGLNDLRSWRDGQLALIFGSDLADNISHFEERQAERKGVNPKQPDAPKAGKRGKKKQ